MLGEKITVGAGSPLTEERKIHGLCLRQKRYFLLQEIMGQDKNRGIKTFSVITTRESLQNPPLTFGEMR